MNRKRLGKFVMTASILTGFVGGGGLWNHYAFTRPSEPQPENGRIYRLSTHGSVAYLTMSENVLLSAVTVIPFLGMGLAAILSRRD